MKNKILIFGGLLLIAAALCLGAYNLWDAHRAEVSVEIILQEMPVVTPSPAPAPKPSPAGPESTEVPPEETEPLPEYVLNPDMEMPVVKIKGQDYIGTLEIPSLEISLPIMSEWSYPKMKISPCRYQGSAYLDNLIICAHNYKAHFGHLKELQPGDSVFFKDAAGNIFSYAVKETEVLAPTDIEGMVSGDWDLTMFTCTIGGKSRVTVRCERLEAPEE